MATHFFGRYEQIFIQGRGRLYYSPKLLGDRQSEKWWLVMMCDPEIGKYLRHLYHLARWRCDSMQACSWECHVTVIRNEEPPVKLCWEKYASIDIDFEYGNEVSSDSMYFWVPVTCERALDVREELGLPRDPEYPLHLTVGNLR